MALIGYIGSYVPVELIGALGYKPYRLLHGETNLCQQAEQLVRVDACPLVKSNLSYILNNPKKFKAIIGSTGCDMSRRMFDVLRDLTSPPVYLINEPRTEREDIFNDEIDWLVKQLEYFSGIKITEELLIKQIELWENQRNIYRVLDEQRGAFPSLISTTGFHKAIINYCQGNIVNQIDLPEEKTDVPRIYFVGSAISYESNPILELLEKDLRIVGDFNCGLARSLNIHIKDKTLAGVKSAYYHQPPDILKRPNHKYYQHIKSELKRLKCTGIIAWTLDYCDNYEFELKKIESEFGLPVLRIRSDFSIQNLSQLKTRISAFAEML